MRKSSTLIVLALVAGAYLVLRNKASAATAALPATGKATTPATAQGTFGTGVPLVSGSGAAGSAAAGAQSNQLINQQYELPASSATTAGLNAQATKFWSGLTAVPPMPTGWIDFPSGAQAAAADFASGLTATDGASTFVLWGTDVYELGARDSAGNYPATLVAGG